jgi:hypothetical protein
MSTAGAAKQIRPKCRGPCWNECLGGQRFFLALSAKMMCDLAVCGSSCPTAFPSLTCVYASMQEGHQCKKAINAGRPSRREGHQCKKAINARRASMQEGHQCKKGINARRASMQEGHQCKKAINARRASMQEGHQCKKGINARKSLLSC